MLGSPFDLSKEIAAIAAKREGATAGEKRSVAGEPAAQQSGPAAHGTAAQRHARLPTAVNLNDLI